MVNIPYFDSEYKQIEREYRRFNQDDTRKKLPVREVAAWWAGYTIRNAVGLPKGELP